MKLNKTQTARGAAFLAGLLILNDELGFDKNGEPKPIPNGAHGKVIIERLQDMAESGEHTYGA